MTTHTIILHEIYEWCKQNLPYEIIFYPTTKQTAVTVAIVDHHNKTVAHINIADNNNINIRHNPTRCGSLTYCPLEDPNCFEQLYQYLKSL